MQAGNRHKRSKRVSKAVKARRQQVQMMLLKRMPQRDIAAKLDVHESTISRDVREIEAYWQREFPVDKQRIMNRELRALDQMEQQAVDQFQATKRVSFLRVRLDIMQRRAKLVGLDQPIKHDVTFDDSWLQKPVDKMTDAELHEAIKQAEEQAAASGLH